MYQPSKYYYVHPTLKMGLVSFSKSLFQIFLKGILLEDLFYINYIPYIQTKIYISIFYIKNTASNCE